MSKDNFSITIQICSNCKQHQWCTRHNQSNYSSLAQDLAKHIKAKDSSIDVEIIGVGGHKMGSFEITCNSTLLFSKINLGYFPHVPSVLTRIFGYIDDVKNGEDLTKYYENKASPIRSHSASFNKSGKNSPKKQIKYIPEYKKENQSAEKENTYEEKNKQPQQQFLLEQAKGEQSMPQQQSVSVKAYDQKEETQKNIETPAKEEKVQKKEQKKVEIEQKKEEFRQNVKDISEPREENKVQVKEQKVENKEVKDNKEQEKPKTLEAVEKQKQKVVETKVEQKKAEQVKKQEKPEAKQQVKKQDSNENKVEQKKQGAQQQAREEGVKQEKKEEGKKQEDENYGDDFENNSAVKNSNVVYADDFENNSSAVKNSNVVEEKKD